MQMRTLTWLWQTESGSPTKLMPLIDIIWSPMFKRPVRAAGPEGIRFARTTVGSMLPQPDSTSTKPSGSPFNFVTVTYNASNITTDGLIQTQQAMSNAWRTTKYMTIHIRHTTMRVDLAWAYYKKVRSHHCQASTPADATWPQRKRTTKELQSGKEIWRRCGQQNTSTARRRRRWQHRTELTMSWAEDGNEWSAANIPPAATSQLS